MQKTTSLACSSDPLSVPPLLSSEGASVPPQPVLLGVSHHTAGVELRERLAVFSARLPDTLQLLRRLPSVEEAVILSTCNRVEFYAASRAPAQTLDDLRDLFCHLSRLPTDTLAAHLYGRTGVEAARHLFRVTAGLDSMILGESEIAAQVKQAYQAACAQGSAGRILNRLFQKALHSAKLARSRTAIAEGQASVGSVIVSLARRAFGGRLETCTVLVWGAGKAAETTMRHLVKQGVGQVWVVNRTRTKAAELAALCQGRCLSWEQAVSRLGQADIAVICTQAPHYLVEAADLAAAGPRRAAAPLLLIDLAVPRNVDPAAAALPGVSLYNIDDLQAQAQDGLVQRRQAAELCENVIGQQTAHFARWLGAAERTQEGRCQLAAA